MKNLIQDSKKDFQVKPNRQLQVDKLSSRMVGREGTYIVNIKSRKTNNKNSGNEPTKREIRKTPRVPLPPTSNSVPTLSLSTSPHEKKRLLQRSEIVCNELRPNKEEGNETQEVIIEKIKLSSSAKEPPQAVVSKPADHGQKKFKQRNTIKTEKAENNQTEKHTSILDTKLPPLEDKSNKKIVRSPTRKSNKQLKMIPPPFRNQEIQKNSEKNEGMNELTSDPSSFPQVETKRHSRKKNTKDSHKKTGNNLNEADKYKTPDEETNVIITSQSGKGTLKRVKKHYSNLNKAVENSSDVKHCVNERMTSPPEPEHRNTRVGVKLESLKIKRQKNIILNEPLEERRKSGNIEQNLFPRKYSNIVCDPDRRTGTKAVFRIDDSNASKQLTPCPPEPRSFPDKGEILNIGEIRRQTALVREKGNRLCLTRMKLAPMEN